MTKFAPSEPIKEKPVLLASVTQFNVFFRQKVYPKIIYIQDRMKHLLFIKPLYMKNKQQRFLFIIRISLKNSRNP